MAMRSVLVGIVLAGVLLGRPGPSTADTFGREVGLAAGASALNLFYVPAKAVFAVSGLALGALASALTGGDARAAYAFWVPAASGTFILRPAQLEGTQPLDFIGTDYADRPSPNRTTEMRMGSDSAYRSR